MVVNLKPATSIITSNVNVLTPELKIALEKLHLEITENKVQLYITSRYTLQL